MSNQYFTTPICKALHPKLTLPEIWSEHKEKFVTVDSTIKGAVFHTKLIMDDKQAAQVESHIEEALDAWKPQNPKYKKEHPSLANVVSVDEEGNSVVQFKRKTSDKFDATPALYDAKGNKVSDLEYIPNGSKLRIKYGIYCWGMTGKYGVHLQPIAVQIVELAEGGSNSAFDEVEGGYQAPSEPAAKPKAEPKVAKAEDEEPPFDDDDMDF